MTLRIDNFMKKILIAFFIIILMVAITLAIFVATFDANRYKSTIEKQISQTIGRPAEIGSLSLKFRNGLALQVDQFTLGEPRATDSPKISFEADRFFLNLEVAPLFRKEIEISECLLESPKIFIENTGNSAPALSLQTGASQPSPSTASAALPPEISDFKISKVLISNGSLVYRDITAHPPLVISVEKLNLELRNISFKSPVAFKTSGELLLGERKYFSAEGRFSYPESSLEFDARLDQSIQISGSLDHLFEIPSGTFKIKIDRLDLSTFLTAEQKRGEYFTGILSAELTASARGSQAEDLQRTLSSAGYVTIDSGALKNKNLLRENLERITQIPGIGALFEFDLGPRFDVLLKSNDTQFDQFKTNYKISNQAVTLQSIELTHQDYAMGLKGSAGLDGFIDLKGSLVIGQVLSEAMLKKVKELSLILGPEGQLTIPFIYRGRVPGAVPQPDFGNLAARTIQTVGAELLEQGLAQLLKPKKSSEEPVSQQANP